MAKNVNPELVKKLYAKYAPNEDVDSKLKYIQDKYGNNQDDFVKSFYAKYDPQVDVSTKLEYINKTYPVKKKDVSEPTSQEIQLESPIQTQEVQATSVTDGQKTELDSVASTGEPSNIVELTDEELGIAPLEYEWKPVLDEQGEPVYYTDNSGQLQPATQKVIKGYASDSEYEQARFEALEERSIGVSPSKEYTNYQSATELSQDELDLIDSEIENELSGDTVKEKAKKGWNVFADVITSVGSFGSETVAPDAIRFSDYPYQKQRDEAKRQLNDEFKGDTSKITEELLDSKTIEIVKKEKGDAIKADKNREYLEVLPSDEKKRLNIEGVEKATSMSDKNKYLITKGSLVEDKLKSIYKNKIKAEEIIQNPEKFKFNEGVEMAILSNGKEVPVTVLNEYSRIVNEVNEKSLELNQLRDDYILNNEELGRAEEEIDFLGRIYSIGEKVRSTVAMGAGDFYVNTVYGVPLFVDELIGIDGVPILDVVPEDEKEDVIGKLKSWNEAKELEKNRLYKDVSFKGLGVNNFGEFMTQEISTQITTFVQMAMPGGVASLGATSTADKYSQMIQEERVIGGKQYSKGQKLGASLGFGLAEMFLGQLPTKGILSRSAKAMEMSGRRQLLNSGFKNFYKKAQSEFGEIIKEGSLEAVTEGLTTLTQNAIDINALDKKDVHILDNVNHSMVSGGLMGGLMRTAPALVGLAMKPFSDNQSKNEVRDNIKSIFSLQESLNNPVLDVEAKKIINKKITSLETSNAKIIDKLEKKVSNISEEAFESVKIISKKQSTLQDEADGIKNNETLSKEIKESLLKDLENEFNLLEDKRVKIISDNATVLDALSDDVFLSNKTFLDALGGKELLELKDKAEKELIKEALDSGKENFEINDKQILERALQIIYNEKQVKQEKKNEKELSEQQRQATDEKRDATDETISVSAEEKIEKPIVQEEVVDDKEVIEETIEESDIITESVNEVLTEDSSTREVTIRNAKNIAKKVKDRLHKDTNPRNVRNILETAVLSYLTQSDWYEKASDIDRESAYKEMYKEIGFKEKSSPSKKKILGIKNKKVLVDEMSALRDQIKLQDKAGKLKKKDLDKKRKNISKIIKGLAKKGVLTTSKSISLINKVSSVNLDNVNDVFKLIKDIENTFNKSDKNSRLLDVKKKAKSISDKVKKGVYGTLDKGLMAITSLANIPPKLVPKDLFDLYESVIDDVYTRGVNPKNVDIDSAISNSKIIIDRVREDVAKIDSLRDLYDIFVDENKLEDSTFSEILHELEEAKIISPSEKVFINERKSSFYSTESKAKKKEEVSADEVVKDLKGAKRTKEMTRRQIEILRYLKGLSVIDINSLSDRSKHYLKEGVSYIVENGRYSAKMQDVINEVESNRRAVKIGSNISNWGVKWTNLSVTLKTNAKNLFNYNITKNRQAIKKSKLIRIDEALGNLKNTVLYDTVFSGLAKAKSVLDTEIKDVASMFHKSIESLGDGNQQVRSNAKITLYSIDKFRKSNPEVSTIHSAKSYLEETIKLIDDKINSKTREMMQDLLDSDIWDNEGNLKDSSSFLSKKEKKGADVIRKELDKQREQAYDTAVYDSKKASPFREDYFPLTNVGRDLNSELNNMIEFAKNPSVSSANLKERDSKEAHAISLNPYNTAFSSIRSTKSQNALTSETKILRDMFRSLNDNTELNREQKELIKQVRKAYEDQLDSVVNSVVPSDKSNSIVMDVIKSLGAIGYRLLLAGFERSLLIELPVNMTGLMTWKGGKAVEAFNDLITLKGENVFDNKDDLRNFLINIKSTQIDRLTTSSLESRGKIDFDVSDVLRSIGRSNLDSETKNIFRKIMKNPKKAKDASKYIMDLTISAPDAITGLPIVLDSFSTKFEEITGEKPDLIKIRDNDNTYFDKYSEAIFESSRKADKDLNRFASSNNKFEGRLSMDKEPVHYRIYDGINQYFRSFMIEEYITAKESLWNLITDENIDFTKKESARLLTASVSRMMLYPILSAAVPSAIGFSIASLVGWNDGGDNEDESLKAMLDMADNESDRKIFKEMYKELNLINKKVDEKGFDLGDTTMKAGLGMMSSLLVGKGGRVKQEAINFLLEEINSRYGEGVTRDVGEKYDKHKSKVFFTKMPVGDRGIVDGVIGDSKFPYKDTKEATLGFAFGQLSPFMKAMESGKAFDIASTVTNIPFAKDIKSIRNYAQYDTKSGDSSLLVEVMEYKVFEILKKIAGKNAKLKEGGKIDLNKIVKESGVDTGLSEEKLKDISDSMNRMLSELNEKKKK